MYKDVSLTYVLRFQLKFKAHVRLTACSHWISDLVSVSIPVSAKNGYDTQLYLKLNLTLVLINVTPSAYYYVSHFYLILTRTLKANRNVQCKQAVRMAPIRKRVAIFPSEKNSLKIFKNLKRSVFFHICGLWCSQESHLYLKHSKIFLAETNKLG